MPGLDHRKEQLAYLRYWQAIMVITNIGLFVWLIFVSGTAHPLIRLCALIGVGAVTLGIYVLHRQIARCIEHIGTL